MLKHRMASGIIAIIVVVITALFLPAMAGWLLVAAISAVAQHEFYSMMKSAGMPVFRILGGVCGSALITATFFALALGRPGEAAAYRWEHIVLLVGLIVVFVRQFPQKHNDKPLETIACTLLGVLYVPYLLNFLTRLAFTWDECGLLTRIGPTGRLLVFYLIVVVKCTDTGAYFVGRFLGKHTLFPRISPAKTWEGLFGGIGSALLGSWIFFLAVEGQLGAVEMHGRDVVILGLVLSVSGVLGDMFESLLKRACGMKDSGGSIPGMGGILDVLDSLLFGAPLLYIYVRLFLT